MPTRNQQAVQCPTCGPSELHVQAYRHEMHVGGVKVLDATGQALVCRSSTCGEVLLTTEQLAGYERRAAALVLRDGRRASGAVLRYARKVLGLRQSELGTLIDSAAETISRWENDREAVPRTVQLAVVALLDAVERREIDVNELVRPAGAARTSLPDQLEVPNRPAV